MSERCAVFEAMTRGTDPDASSGARAELNHSEIIQGCDEHLFCVCQLSRKDRATKPSLFSYSANRCLCVQWLAGGVIGLRKTKKRHFMGDQRAVRRVSNATTEKSRAIFTNTQDISLPRRFLLRVLSSGPSQASVSKGAILQRQHRDDAD